MKTTGGEDDTGDTRYLRLFDGHPLRDAVLGEVHARPFRPLPSPRVVLHYAFLTDAEEAEKDRAWFAVFCCSQGAAGPLHEARHHSLSFGGGILSWERHTEFTTYTWDGPASGGEPFSTLPVNHPFGAAFRAPGEMLVATRIDFLPSTEEVEWQKHFDPISLTAFRIDAGRAFAATDFRPDGDGHTRFLVLNDAMTDFQSGTAVQRLLEVETYRCLALLGLFEANRLQPGVRAIETELVTLTQQMKSSAGLDANRKLLESLTGLAATLEASAAESIYRFGASRAYFEIVMARLQSLDEEPVESGMTMSAFLNRRLMPAMRTCQAVEERQAMLSRKLARTTTLLRTRVDVDLEQQNRSLLESMSRRARLQLRLQQTVEGLSVAAISYYVVGLFSYLAKGIKDAGLTDIPLGLMTGAAVPAVVLIIWWTVRRIRAYHSDKDGH